MAGVCSKCGEVLACTECDKTEDTCEYRCYQDGTAQSGCGVFVEAYPGRMVGDIKWDTCPYCGGQLVERRNK